MKLAFFKSDPAPRVEGGDPDYTLRFESRYADRFVGNLGGAENFCAACGPACVFCRKQIGRRFGDRIVKVVSFPGVLPYILEHPEEYVPRDLPPHDVLVVINIHEQVLLETLKVCRRWGTRGVIAPIEEMDWISGAARAEAERIAAREGIEIDFPRPFCTFRPPEGTLLAEFRRAFHIGEPEVRFEIAEGKIQSAHVEVSAPCGATYYIARGLVGRSVDEDLAQIVSTRLHSYPCTASMEWDGEINDTILHVGAHSHLNILEGIAAVRDPDEIVLSPLGRVVRNPLPLADNLRAVEQAEAAILAEMCTGRAVSLVDLRRLKRHSPAALHTALLNLVRAGKVRVEGAIVLPTLDGSDGSD
jgi:hypothetical protein